MPFEDMMNVFNVVDICKYDDKARYSFTTVVESASGFALVPFTVKKTCNSICTIAVSQRGCRTEEAEGNHDFNQNHYARKVTVGVAKLKKAGAALSRSTSTPITSFEKEKTPYPLRDQYLEFKSLEAGDYYLYADIDWSDTNVKAAKKEFSVNCYGPVDVVFGLDESMYANKDDAIECTNAKLPIYY